MQTFERAYVNETGIRPGHESEITRWGCNVERDRDGEREREDRNNFFLSVRYELGPDQEVFVVLLRETLGRGKEVFAVASHIVYLIGVLIKGATHGQRQGILLEMRILNRARDTIRWELCGPRGDGGEGRTRWLSGGRTYRSYPNPPEIKPGSYMPA